MHDHDHEHDHALSFDRRTFLAATSALSLFAMNDTAMAQQPAAGQGAPDKRLRQILAEFVVGFDLSKVPAEVVDRRASPSSTPSACRLPAATRRSPISSPRW